VCGYPTKSGGDLYGGAHYLDSSAATMTLQGRAIKQAAIDFGDGKTLPFTPCKKGYIALLVVGDNVIQKVACPLHEKARRKRLAKEDNQRRKGEANPDVLFWLRKEDVDVMHHPVEPIMSSTKLLTPPKT
jgi:hypothetical protein